MQGLRDIILGATVVMALAGCAQDPKLVASNCDKSAGCVQSEPLRVLDKVDILLVIDDSTSVEDEQAAFKRELPRMLNAITHGEANGLSFPAADSVHVGVVTTDMGIGTIMFTSGTGGCQGLGDDGILVRYTDHELAGCEISYPGYLAYDGTTGAIATTDTVACIPVVGSAGCGFEQPLEAALKALWPANDPRITFLGTNGYGASENAGFVRPDSLLVVVAVTDEDDCSILDAEMLRQTGEPPSVWEGAPQPQLQSPSPELWCQLNPTRLYPVKRYVDGLRALRPDNDNLIFAVVAGVPADLLPAEGSPDFDAILADERMQFRLFDPGTPDDLSDDRAERSCSSKGASAQAPTRLVQTVREFGANGVLASVCDDDFGHTTARLIRAIGSRLAEYAKTKP